MRNPQVLKSFSILLFAFISFVPAFAADTDELNKTITGEHRSNANSARDQYRHPYQTLQFFGIKSNMAVVEVWPGGGWYTEILAPYLKNGGGSLTAAGFQISTVPKFLGKIQIDYETMLAASPALYKQIKVIELGPPKTFVLGPNNSADAVLTFRNAHNWLKGGFEDDMFNAFYNVLKPGGILGLTDHRAAENSSLAYMKKFGYLDQNLVIRLAKKAGFVLEATSEINANPLDTKIYPEGVWSLPPTLRLKEQNKAKYLAIGESDRMTLKFRKPK